MHYQHLKRVEKLPIVIPSKARNLIRSIAPSDSVLSSRHWDYDVISRSASSRCKMFTMNPRDSQNRTEIRHQAPGRFAGYSLAAIGILAGLMAGFGIYQHVTRAEPRQAVASRQAEIEFFEETPNHPDLHLLRVEEIGRAHV